MAKQKSKILIYLEFGAFYLFYRLVRWLSFPTAVKLGRSLAAVAFLVDFKHRPRTVAHIMHSGIVDNLAAAKQMARASAGHCGQLLIEILKRDQMYDPRLISAGGSPGTINFITAQSNTPGGQVIIITAHLGNWEIAGTAFSDMAGRPMTSLMRAFDNPYIGELILSGRRSGNHETVDKRKGIRPLLKALNTGRNATLLIDQHASTSEGIECVFFGHPARVHITPALLHLKTGVPIMPAVTRRTTRGEYKFEIVFGDLIRQEPTDNKEQDIQVLTQRCIASLEELIRQYPEQWLWAARHWLDINRKPRK